MGCIVLVSCYIVSISIPRGDSGEHSVIAMAVVSASTSTMYLVLCLSISSFIFLLSSSHAQAQTVKYCGNYLLLFIILVYLITEGFRCILRYS